MSGKLVRFASIVMGIAAVSSPVAAETGRQLAHIVAAQIGGQPARLEVDTGAFFSMVTPRAVERFKLKPTAMIGPWRTTTPGSRPIRGISEATVVVASNP
ncbi:retropepsin-like aspartic protease [Phenylobacterium sp. LjRoot225]|uniref:aspartyl protease family protein n=1 Tax=Phenylobacterium sp. LjRoot225 TaxID=3342285 RepID=UPI003ED001AB